MRKPLIPRTNYFLTMDKASQKLILNDHHPKVIIPKEGSFCWNFRKIGELFLLISKSQAVYWWFLENLWYMYIWYHSKCVRYDKKPSVLTTLVSPTLAMGLLLTYWSLYGLFLLCWERFRKRKRALAWHTVFHGGIF